MLFYALIILLINNFNMFEKTITNKNNSIIIIKFKKL